MVKEGLWHILPIERTSNRVPEAIIDHSRDGHEPTRTIIASGRAKLIAAAPEMYEALKMYVATGAPVGTFGDVAYAKGIAALIKAEGK